MRVRNGLMVVVLVLCPATSNLSGQAPSEPSFEQFLEASAVPKEVIDRFLRGPSWARFDSELGYVPGNYLPADGMDKSSSMGRALPSFTWTENADSTPMAIALRTAIMSMMRKHGRSISPHTSASRFVTSAWVDMASIRPTAEWYERNGRIMGRI